MKRLFYLFLICFSFPAFSQTPVPGFALATDIIPDVFPSFFYPYRNPNLFVEYFFNERLSLATEFGPNNIFSDAAQAKKGFLFVDPTVVLHSCKGYTFELLPRFHSPFASSDKRVSNIIFGLNFKYRKMTGVGDRHNGMISLQPASVYNVPMELHGMDITAEIGYEWISSFGFFVNADLCLGIGRYTQREDGENRLSPDDSRFMCKTSVIVGYNWIRNRKTDNSLIQMTN